MRRITFLFVLPVLFALLLPPPTAQGFQEDDPGSESAFQDEGFNIKAWPLVVDSTSDDGTRSLWATPLFHYTSAPNGDEWFHLLNYFQGPDYRLIIPLAYSAGEKDNMHMGVIPAIFCGPGYLAMPPLLYLSLDLENGDSTTWITPFYHVTRDAQGEAWLHVGPFFKGPGWWFLFPLGYSIDTSKGPYAGVIPFFIKGPGYWIALPFLSGSWDSSASSRETWITPLYHESRDVNGNVRFHFLNYFQGPEHNVFFPLAYIVGKPGKRKAGVIPFYFQWPGAWMAPPFLSASWKRKNGSRTTWLTPLFHHTKSADGENSLHALTYFQGPGYNLLFPLLYIFDESGEKTIWAAPIYFQGKDYLVLFPLAYWAGEPENRHMGLLPFYIRTPSSRIVPPLLSGVFDRNDGGRSTWITPFFHHTRDGEGDGWMHLFNYFQGPGYKLFLPLAYMMGGKERRKAGVIPFYFQWPGTWIAPPLLSASWEREGGGRVTWLTPLFHCTEDEDGERSFHFLNYFQGSEDKVLFPLAYHSKGEKGDHFGIFPLFFRSPDSTFVLPLLSGWWKRGAGGRSIWITPLYHSTTDGHGKHWFHVVNYFQGPDDFCFFPLLYYSGAEGNEWLGVFPLCFSGPDSIFFPFLLSGRWKGSDGTSNTWITPLFHTSTDRLGQTEFHCLNYFQGPGYKLLFPFAYSLDKGEKKYRGVIPFYFQWPGAAVSPLMLYASWERQDGGRNSWATPLFHQSTDSSGRLENRHLVNWFESDDFETLFPLYWNWKNSEGVERTLVPPLYSKVDTPEGECSHSVLWPLFEYRNGKTIDHSFLTQMKPFLYQRAGADYEFSLLWELLQLEREDGNESTTVAPFYYSERPAGEKLSRFQVLGGLYARDCDYTSRTSRKRLFWIFPIGSENKF